MVIEQHVPEVPDRQVQLADGVLDLRGPGWSPISPSAVSRESPAQNSRCTTMSFMPPAMRSCSCTSRRVTSAESAALPGGGSRVGRRPGSSSSGISTSQGRAAEACIAEAPWVLTGRDWPCHHGLERRGHLRTYSGLAQDLIDICPPSRLRQLPELG